MSEHTPTPWEVFNHGRLLVIAPQSGWSVFEIADSHPTDRPTHEANAAFIVKCVNLHEELVTALRKVADTLTYPVSTEIDPRGWGLHSPNQDRNTVASEIVNAILAKVAPPTLTERERK